MATGGWNHVLVNALATRWRAVPVLIALVLIWAVFAYFSPVFFSARNLTNLADQITTTAIVAAGLVFVLIIAEIDLSVAGVAAVCGAIAGVLLVNQGLPLWLSLACALLAGALYGVFQGFVIVRSGAPAFIVTLGFSLGLQGALLLLLPSDSGLVALAGTGMQTLTTYRLAPALSYGLVLLAGIVFIGISISNHFQRKKLGLATRPLSTIGLGVGVLIIALVLIAVFNSYRGVPLSVAVAATVLAVLSYVLSQTKFGIWVYAIGGNREAARRAAIPVDLIRVAVFVVLGVMAALGGLIASARVLGVSAASANQTLLLESIAAAVIGGTSLFGGKGSVWSAVLGALVIGSIANGMFLINASTPARLLVQGGVLVLAVVVDALIARSSTAR